ncbi:MAG TPA: S41 family peptidase [Desulfuromonadaceae bacterium]
MFTRLILILATTALLAGCGGSGSSSAPDPAQEAAKTWVRGFMDDTYLWYNEIVDVPPTNYATAPDYFKALLVKSRDRFSFSMPLDQAVNQLLEGLETGYGVKLGMTAAGRLFALYVDPNSPAAASLIRGAEITAVNGQPLANLTSTDLSSALSPGQPGATVNLTFRRPGTATFQTTSLVSATFSTTTVGQPSIISLAGGGKAGYLLFNQHLRTSEQGLINAMTYFKQQGISELVLDMRYNTGGALSIAQEVASMIGGTAVQGKTFEKLLFNTKHPEQTNDPQNTYRFSALDSTGAQLPLLGLRRVFVLTGPNTCSASESVINGLLPHIPVIRIGWTTCGKPYGFFPTTYGQQTYFAIQVEGVNANGTDDFKSGFAPTCQAYDDLNYPLGNTNEASLNAAVSYMGTNACPPMRTVTLPKTTLSGAIPGIGDIQLIGQLPGLKLLK